jgi:hypothetical protein
MRFSSMMRGARAAALATLILSLGLSPSFARVGGVAGGSFAHPSFGMGHFSHPAPGGFNRRFETRRFGFQHSGPNRFDRFGDNRFNRLGRNQFFLGGWGWGGWGGFPTPAASEPILVGDSAPIIINIGVDPAQGGVPVAYAGGCVIHKLNYDSNGKYVGERQIPQC